MRITAPSKGDLNWLRRSYTDLPSLDVLSKMMTAWGWSDSYRIAVLGSNVEVSSTAKSPLRGNATQR